jgi:predicted ATP-grasp superfamily ATP-dependent carboligase
MKYKILIPDYLKAHIIAGLRALQPHIVDLANNNWFRSHFAKSRYIKHLYRVPPPENDIEGYVLSILKILDNDQYNLLLPFGLAANYACTVNRDKLASKVGMLLPSVAAINIANDKEKSFELCREAGIECPNTYSIKDEQDLKSFNNQIRFPAVIKTRSGTGVLKGVRYAQNKDELVRNYFDICSRESDAVHQYSRPIVQEFIPGYIHDACTLSVKGNAVNVLTQMRRIMYPIYGGVGAINITTVDRKLDALARKTLEVFSWQGPAQIEFKFDPRDKKYKFIELNPKLWGTLDLSIKAGMNFPKLILDYVTTGRTSNIRYKEGVMYIFKYPQAVYARQQLQRINRTDLLPRINEYLVYNDFDRNDFWPDTLRALRTYIGMLRGKINYKTNNIDIDAVLGESTR